MIWQQEITLLRFTGRFVSSGKSPNVDLNVEG